MTLTQQPAALAASRCGSLELHRSQNEEDMRPRRRARILGDRAARAAPAPRPETVTRLLAVTGFVLVLGGVGHSAGVTRFYVTGGLPDANRIALDIWIAEAQLLSGGMYIAASRALRAESSWRVAGVFGALTVIGYAVPMLPVLIARAPFIFRVPPMIYLVVSVFIFVRAVHSE